MGAAASAQKNFDQFVGSDGKLDLQEFGLMFKNAGQGGAVSQEQIVKLFEAFDRSGDGEVDRKEFTDVVQALYAVATTKPPPKPKVISSDKKTCPHCNHGWYDKYGKNECPKCLKPLTGGDDRGAIVAGGGMSYMAKDGPDVTTKVLGDAEFNDKWGCKKNLDPDGSKGIHKEWRFGKCRDCGMGEGKYNTAFQEWMEKQRGY